MNLDNISIEEQRKLVFAAQPAIKLTRPCRLNDGIISHAEFEKNRYKVKFENNNLTVHFFIPASGSGSRMFQFLYEFLAQPSDESRSKTEHFLNAIEDFAFFELLPYQVKKKVREYDISLDQFVSYLLKSEGLGLGLLPKGLVPFHRSRSFILNAFQEHFLQGLSLKEEGVSFHFTINKLHEEKVLLALDSIQHLTGRDVDIELSEQDPNTHSVAFDNDQNVVTDEEGEPLKRPSGHGALLKNLNTISSDILFIKNIDNIQHESHAAISVDNLKYLGGLLSVFKTELKEAFNGDQIRKELSALNLQYQFTQNSTDFEKMTDGEIRSLICRPIRVCGMVKNEGQAGGGPFWVQEEDNCSKQIVEKSQISKDVDQYRLMVQSQYFNPVIMAVSTKDIDGNKLDLNAFSDHEKYFIVHKTVEGKEIQFIERPGLWNGSMANWITIFVEVPSHTFTPVKTALDLLNDSHKEVD